MIQKRKVKAMYVVQIVCEECGKPMHCSHALCTYPAQYCYYCPDCDTHTTSTTKNGAVEYEFEDE